MAPGYRTAEPVEPSSKTYGGFMSQEDTPVSFDEIRALLEHLPEADLEAARAASEREASLTKPAGALGRLEELTRWLATWQAL
jgi:hypothetical protein